MLIEELRRKKEILQITASQLAGLTDIPTGIINRLLQGEIESPSPDILKKLEQVLFPEKFSSYGSASMRFYVTSDIIREAMPAYQTGSIGKYTVENYLALPDNVRAELIDGNIIYMEAPTVTHQGFLAKIFFAIESYILNSNGSCRTFFAPLDVQLDCDDKTMVQPDIIVVCDKDKITEKRIYGAPDFCIEIMSPSSRNHDQNIKLRKYRLTGVREYWMADIEKRQVICYFFEDDICPAIYPFETPVPVHIFHSKLSIDFAKIESHI